MSANDEDQTRLDSNDSKNTEDAATTEIIEIPDGGYGWVVVFAFLLLNTFSFGANAAFAIYLAYYLEVDLFHGATKLDFAAIGGLSSGIGLTLTPLIFLVKRKLQTRLTAALGTFLQFVGLLLAGFSTKLWQLYLTQGLLVGCGIGFIFVPVYAVIPQWFREKRSLAVSIAAAGSGCGGVIFSLSIQAAIKHISLKWAFFIQDICCTVMCIVGVLLVRSRDEEVKTDTQIWDFKLVKIPVFNLCALFGFFAMQGYVVLLYNLADFTKTLGYDSHQASIVACMVSVGAFFGRPTLGRVSDKFGAITTNIVAHLLVALFCFAFWIPLRTLAGALVFALIQGALMGSMWVVVGPLCTRVFGLRKLSIALNMIWVIMGISSIVSPVIGIKLRGVASNGAQYSPDQYLNPAIYCGAMYLGAGLMLCLIRSYLIARDKLSENLKTNEDSDELDVTVGFGSLFSNIFKKSPSRKI